MKRMSEQEKIKFGYECMVRNNPDEAIKELIRFEKSYNIIKTLKNNLTKSISSIDKKISENVPPWENGYINNYRIARLRAIRSKCKELLDIIEE